MYVCSLQTFKFWIRSLHVVCASLRDTRNYVPFSKKRTTSNPPPQFNTTPCPHSNTKVFTTVENEPLGDITPSDVKDVAANNNTKQLFTEVVPRRKAERLTTRFYTFPPYILFKRRQGTRQFYPTKFIKWVPKPGPTQFYCTYKHGLELFSEWCHWKAVCGGSLWNWPTSTIFKNADPGPFYHYFFIIFCTLALWLSKKWVITKSNDNYFRKQSFPFFISICLLLSGWKYFSKTKECFIFGPTQEWYM